MFQDSDATGTGERRHSNELKSHQKVANGDLRQFPQG